MRQFWLPHSIPYGKRLARFISNSNSHGKAITAQTKNKNMRLPGAQLKLKNNGAIV